MPIVTTGDITISDINDGLNAFLTQDACLIATATDGSGGNFAIANTTMVVRQGTADVSSQWTVTAAPSAGVTGSLSVRTYSVSAMSVDTGFVDLTASKLGETSITLRFTITKAKQGSAGSPGAAGERGSITAARAIAGTVWSDSEAATAISDAGGIAPIRGDVVTLHNNASNWSQTRVRTTQGTWAVLAAFFGGDVLVNGTVIADKLAANSVTANKIAAGSVQAVHIQAGAITTSKLNVTDFTNLVPDPNFSELGVTWANAGSTGSVIDAPSADWLTPKVLRIQSNLTFRGFPSPAFAVNPGDPLWFWFQAQVISGTGNLQGQVQFSADTTFNTIISTVSVNISSSTVTTGSTMIAAAPTGARYARVRYVHPVTGIESLFSMPVVRRAASGELIVDGSIVANKIATGAVNAAKIEAGSILASKIAIGDTTNVFPDYDMWDAAFYSTNGPSFTLVATTDPVSGANELQLAAPGEAYTGWSAIEASSQIRARAVTRNGVAALQRIGTVFIEFGTVGAGGAVTATRRVQILQRAGAITHVAAEIDVALTASENRFRFVLERTGTNLTSFVTMSGLRVRKRVAGELIVDGSIDANKVGANEIIAQVANIKDGIITNAKIADLSAAKLTAGTALAGSITVNGRAVADISVTDKFLDVIDQDWTRTSGIGTGTGTYSTTDGHVTGTRVLLSNADGWSHFNKPDAIPFNPTKLYRVSFLVRRVSGTTGQMDLGVWLLNESKTWIATLLVSANAVLQNNVPTSFTEYVGYIKGHAVSQALNGASIANPAVALNGTRFLRPIAMFNNTLSGGGAVMALDSVSIEVMPEETAELVNRGTTQIDPGKILISGATTLADWRRGTDLTKIDGGAISANTVDANKLTVGSRAITVTNIVFDFNSPGANQVSWTAGQVRWVNDAGTATNTSIAAGSATWTTGMLYIYFDKTGTLKSTTTIATAFGANVAIIATYAGGNNLVTDYGKTIIDGSSIKTGTITATQMAAGSITTDKLVAGGINANVIGAGKMNARFLEVTERLDMTDSAAFSVGKQTAFDLNTDGLFFGKTASAGFGFLSGRVNGAGEAEYIQHTTETGLKIANANYELGGGTPARVMLTTSQTYNLPADTTSINLAIVGGGGGGQGAHFGPAPANHGSQGETTTVVLRDGTTTIATWTAVGGLGSAGSGVTASYFGANNFGSGGAGAYYIGGGEPGNAGWAMASGKASPVVLTGNVSVIGLTSPNLLITRGAGGAGGSGSLQDGSAGFPGAVEANIMTSVMQPAGVIARKPTATGTFAVTGVVAGTFPNISPNRGLWVLTGTPTNFTINYTPENTTIVVPLNASSISFIASKTPTWNTAHSTTRTVYYAFYPM
jgi:hypothetical protein